MFLFAWFTFLRLFTFFVYVELSKLLLMNFRRNSVYAFYLDKVICDLSRVECLSIFEGV